MFAVIVRKEATVLAAASHLCNPELLSAAWATRGRVKEAFMPQGSPGLGGDPSGGAAAGAPPPADPMGGSPGGGGGGVDAGTIRQIMMEVMQGGGAGGAGNPSGAAIKPKIDVNVELMQIKNILAKIADTLGIPIPAQDMVATPDKLQAMAGGQPTTSGAQVGGQPQHHHHHGQGQQGASAIQPPSPVQPMQGAFPAQPGKSADDQFSMTASKADALLRIRAAKRSAQ